MLVAGDLSASAEHVRELREADTVTQTRSSSRASEQQRTDVTTPSSVPVALSSVSVAPSSVPTASIPVRSTRVRFVQARRGTAGHTDQRSLVREAVPDRWERQIIEVISVVDALREEVRKRDRERQEQHEELIRMIRTLQGTSTQMHTDEPFHYEAPGVTPLQRDSAPVHGTETSHRETAASPPMLDFSCFFWFCVRGLFGVVASVAVLFSLCFAVLAGLFLATDKLVYTYARDTVANQPNYQLTKGSIEAKHLLAIVISVQEEIAKNKASRELLTCLLLEEHPGDEVTTRSTELFRAISSTRFLSLVINYIPVLYPPLYGNLPFFPNLIYLDLGIDILAGFALLVQFFNNSSNLEVLVLKEEIVDEEDDKLKNLKREDTEQVYNAVTVALNERNEYHLYGRNPEPEL
ncbi:hypothetical protein EZV62_026351 [Acer yangbiense]|uniref:Factor of DNA methylation 1-5/IDN2 domain-containing protein n=1 Tax=Acer yangbiense TaxID=1000413 RepID=A0A5C7GRH5_9ROSI|nr:hypothetical protein EZV62_026351 [Acer yangbiense]